MKHLLQSPYESVQDVTDGLAALEAWCIQRQDLRGVFATAYLCITRAIQRELGNARFHDSEWQANYLIAFGNLYRRALLDYEEGRKASVPKAWRIAFDEARARSGFIMQHLTLGINAHINHDLPLALVEIGIDPSRADKYADHTLTNAILSEATDGLKQDVSRMYAPILLRLDRLAGTASSDLTNFSIPKAREHAWAMAVALTSARTSREIDLVKRTLDDQAAVMARVILSSPTRHPAVVKGVGIAKRLDAAISRATGLPGLRRLFRR
jgi:hypothetical protein